MSSSTSSSSTESDNLNPNIERDENEDSSGRKRYSEVYQYFTFHEDTKRWYCDFCE
jgi:hypothetical protein